MDSFYVPGIIRGYHLYQTLVVREKTITATAPGNKHYRYAVAIFEDETCLLSVGNDDMILLRFFLLFYDHLALITSY